MIITCPSCATRYSVDPLKLGSGRDVRCAKCGNSWRQEPPADLPKTVEPPPPRPRPLAAGPTISIAPAKPKRRGAALGWVLFLLVIGVFVVGGYVGRDTIVAAWPQTQRLYATLGVPVELPNLVGVELRNLRSQSAIEGGVAVLIVSGEVVNPTRETRRAPPLRIGLRDAERREIFNKTFTLENEQVAPSASVPFTVRLASPPAEARDLEVSFAVAPRQGGR